MESYIPISYLNDFVFCPRSIYCHQLYGNISKRFYHTTSQTAGLNTHSTIDNRTYTTAKTILQGLDIYSSKYGLCGKIDTYDTSKKLLVERKKKIKIVYDGYIFQLYAQYFCLTEMDYEVHKMKLYSMDDNKSYFIPLPENSSHYLQKFKVLMQQIRDFDLDDPFSANPKKCQQCVYSQLCDYSPD